MSYMKVKLEDCLELVLDYRGKTPKKVGGDWDENGEYRAISAKNIKDMKLVNLDSIKRVDEEVYRKWMKEEVQKDDILLTSEAPLGESLLWDSDEKIVLSQRVFGIRVNKEILYPRYFFFYMNSRRFIKELNRGLSGSTVFGIRQELLLKTEINVISLEEQKKVGDYLYKIHCLIRKNKVAIHKLEEYANLLFYKWFIDYNFPDSKGKPYKDSGGELVEVNGKLIPKEWSIEPLAKFIEKTSNGDWGEENPYDGAVETYCIRGADMPNIKNGIIGNTPLRYIKNSKDREKRLTHGNIVIEASGGSPTQSTGRTVLIRDSLLKRIDKPLYFSNFSKVIIPKEHYSMFLYHLLNNLYHRDVFFHYEGKTSGLKNLLLNNMLKRVKFVSPSLELLKRFEEETGVLWDKIFSLGHENELLEETRDLLIKKLIK